MTAACRGSARRSTRCPSTARLTTCTTSRSGCTRTRPSESEATQRPNACLRSGADANSPPFSSIALAPLSLSRRYSFLNSSRILKSDREDRLSLGVRGASTWTDAAPLGGSTTTDADGKQVRKLSMAVGDSYEGVRASLDKAGWGSAYVVQVDARSLELLCEVGACHSFCSAFQSLAFHSVTFDSDDFHSCAFSSLRAEHLLAFSLPPLIHTPLLSLLLLHQDLGSAAANRDFNTIMHTVLGVAEQVRYCDAYENPTYGIGPNAHDEWRNPINCTWGFQRPPKLPETDSPQCSTDATEMLASRLVEAQRKWDNPAYRGFMSRRRQAWSTPDRPAYLHKN